MNRHLSDLPGEGEQRDPVADFFAHERADIRDLPAGADRSLRPSVPGSDAVPTCGPP